MKKLSVSLVILLAYSLLFGQNKLNNKPFIIKGQIANCPEKFLPIHFRDKNGQVLIDTLNLDEFGNFYLKTFKVQEPQKAIIQKNSFTIDNLFVAPGYNLTITGNGKDNLTFFKTKKITGVGAESNKYYSILDSIAPLRLGISNWFQLNETNLLTYILEYRKVTDSIVHVVFDRKAIQDKFLKYFGSLTRMDKLFYELYMLVTHVNNNNYSYEKSISFVRNNFDSKILENLYNSEYLVSDVYRDALISNEYIKYLVTLDYKKDSSLRNQKEYKLKKINDTYKGKVKEFALYRNMQFPIRNINSIEQLNYFKDQYAKYITNLSNHYFKKSILSKFTEKELELLKTQVGNPAPQFTLESNLKKQYSLVDFKGKVVYIDLWASWCSPCRAETPSFKELYNQYKNDNRIIFLSIAVDDGFDDWKKAIEEDKAEWLQLIDKDRIVSKSYITNTIPKFILIDKEGNIVNFDAPRPSSGDEIKKLLNKEIER
ncbi:TlpA family protein disulfide reductase [Ferruginibacter sp. SUN106]|uniref:TlpA family protein disulfide reductase n=1 Tax=Ferruginibacter sp. SUN106 TaxID=2978348 RepID=UPI003D361DDA